jgi:hypothetical protein
MMKQQQLAARIASFVEGFVRTSTAISSSTLRRHIKVLAAEWVKSAKGRSKMKGAALCQSGSVTT